LLNASIVPATLRNASLEMGEQLLALAESWPWAGAIDSRARSASKCIDTPLLALRTHQVNGSPSWHHAVVFATLAAAAGASPRNALLVYLNQAAMGAISAGVRAIPIGHTHGQQVLARLHDDITTLAEVLSESDLATAGSFCAAYEVRCHAQTQLYTRIFRS
jgi:urease accessory protein